jgi:hypothetical protein
VACVLAGCGGSVAHRNIWSADDEQSFMSACQAHETITFCGCAYNWVTSQYVRPADLPNSKGADDQTLASAAGRTAGEHPSEVGC